MITAEANNIIKSEKEITLLFLLKMDLNIYDHVTKGTVEAYEVQEVKFPEEYKDRIEK